MLCWGIKYDDKNIIWQAYVFYLLKDYGLSNYDWSFTLYALASPAMGHWGTCPPLDLQQLNFLVRFDLYKVWQRLYVDSCIL